MKEFNRWIFFIVSLVLILTLDKVHGLKCFQCTYEKEPEFGPPTSKHFQCLNADSHLPNKLKVACKIAFENSERKQSVAVCANVTMTSTKDSSINFLTRECVELPTEPKVKMGCRSENIKRGEAGEIAFKSVTCYCDTNGCNLNNYVPIPDDYNEDDDDLYPGGKYPENIPENGGRRGGSEEELGGGSSGRFRRHRENSAHLTNAQLTTLMTLLSNWWLIQRLWPT